MRVQPFYRRTVFKLACGPTMTSGGRWHVRRRSSGRLSRGRGCFHLLSSGALSVRPYCAGAGLDEAFWFSLFPFNIFFFFFPFSLSGLRKLCRLPVW
ncbi:hypothetical protein EUGRSUZ_E02474 [Eucalyptus grandis]|uniref:Uncharacterized protein n=2 Tax=Eucalyptus grandis TaxID=71139 RepID=A0ACC3KWJ3_EUCGR|nr:hypothetical protein EUGRSUZ_E02474 [Eucalyptus grandis]